MNLHLTSLALKWASAWVVLSLFGMVGGPAPAQAGAMAAFVAIVTWVVDRAMPFTTQGLIRWAIESVVAFLAIYLGQFLSPGPGISLNAAAAAGMVIGAIELPLHFWLAVRYGLRRGPGDKNGIR
jgi:hypothetical protein